ncbi:CGNR zinc finger domain-containing protein [Amycolatopsis sp.]|uniref:CGNR zinc finger domain-containing protein n=1 Tax=Amycolatopsis sp. TaxID=37632 RepID=UPI002CF30E44|nr:CGNR zinc finger domain-containing protein [Amycolatopsis sp.]HVV08698.1 CGNR zinc finger domain-containing protein [Amycolatopsis sp.]
MMDPAQRAADLVNVLLPGPATAAQVREVLLAHDEPEPIELGEDDLAEMREAAVVLREVFAAETTAAAAAALNVALAEHARPPRLTTHDGGFAWHLHVDSSDDAPWGEWLLTSSSLALAFRLTERQRPPGGICACGKSFVDTGRGERKRYCSSRCATRARVAAHRARS